MLWLLLTSALAQSPPETVDEPVPHRAPALSAGIGLAQSTRLPIAGIDLSWMASPTKPSLHGRIAPAWGFSWAYKTLPSGREQLNGISAQGPLIVRNTVGGTLIAPLEQQAMDMRFGLEVGGEMLFGAGFGAVEVGPIGYAPRAIAIAEFVRDGKSESAVGLRMGVGSIPDVVCDPSLSTECIEWRPGFVGGVYLYYWASHKVHIEAEIGATTWVTVGYRF
ncbi:MAG: hypothetical protein KC912_11920 [Proteobacteria bacterium]|nr:hypothetical protein [Pseudomonadota bacterium]